MSPNPTPNFKASIILLTMSYKGNVRVKVHVDACGNETFLSKPTSIFFSNPKGEILSTLATKNKTSFNVISS